MKKIIVITGGTSGFGLETIKVFLREEKDNAQIISISRSEDKINKAKKQLGGNAKFVEFLQADVSSPEAIQSVVNHITDKYSKVDILVNNAGTIIPGGVESLECNDWDWVIKNNLSSYYYMTKLFVPLLKNSKSGSIVNISSISAKLGGSSIAYSVSKAGVDMITKTTAKELVKYGIRVNAISPGMANTGFHIWNNVYDENGYNQMLDNVKKDYPLGIGESIDIAEMIYYLSSEKAKWMTGSNILVDGGKSL